MELLNISASLQQANQSQTYPYSRPYETKKTCKPTYKPQCYWLGEAELVEEKDSIYTYMLSVSFPRGKDVCSWLQKGWVFIVKGKDELTFIKKVEDVHYLSWYYMDRHSPINRKVIFFDLPFKVEDWMYIAPLNQYELGFTNEEVIKEINSYWPQTFNTYD